MAVFIAGSWGCGTSAARSRRKYRHILLLFISVYCVEILPSCPSCEFDGKVQVIAEVQINFVLFCVVLCCVVRSSVLRYWDVEH